MKELFDCVAAGNVDDLEKFIDKLVLEEKDETKGKGNDDISIIKSNKSRLVWQGEFSFNLKEMNFN